MRLHPFLPLAAVVLVGSLKAQRVEQTLKWARENIDAHAVTNHLEPPARVNGTKWQVVRVQGCNVELKETLHREAPNSVANSEGVFGFAEDKIVTWSFDLGSLLPQYIMADTSIGAPHMKIFAEGDAFHTKTESTSRLVRKDGSTESSTTWTNSGNARNLMMYFDSPATDNRLIVKRLESDLREAVSLCAVQTAVR